MRVAEDDLRVEIVRFEGFEAKAFDGARGADRHEDGRVNHTTARRQHPRPCLTVLSLNCKADRIHVSLERSSVGSSCISRRPSAYLCVLCVEIIFNAEIAEIRRGPQRKR